jgi:hypothetical protein
MKEYYGNHLGICINNNDPENRGRVQVFIPHIMPALYEGWNELGEDIKLECVGDNLPNGLSSKVIEKLRLILPWAEAAMPVIGNSVAGSYNPETGNFNQTNTPEAVATVGTSADPSKTIVSASGVDGSGTTTVTYADGTTTTLTGPRPIRNNNPGNLEFGPFAKSQGAVGSDGRYAVFPTPEIGQQAKINLLKTGTYQSLTLTAAFNRYAPPSENPSYLQDLRNFTGFDLNRRLSSLSDSEFNTLIGAVAKIEGFGTPIDIRNPATAPDPSAAGAAAVPFAKPEPYLVQDKPNQDAITQVNAPTPVSVGPGVGTNIWNRVNSKYPNTTNNCGVRARDFDYLVTGDSYFNQGLSVTGGNPGGWASKSTEYWLNSGYYKLAETPPASLPFGTKIIFQNNKSGTNAGHVTTVADGKLVGSGGNESWSSYAKLNNNEATFLVPTQKYIDVFKEKYKSGLPEYSFSEVTKGGTAIADDGGNDTPSQIVKNTTETTAVPLDTTGMAQGMFGVPGPGAMLWVFFREGDPMFPVYFAASYGAAEWQSAYKASSPPAYGPQENSSTSISNQTVFRPNNAGAITFTGAIDAEKDARTVRMAHANGGYVELHPYGTVHYSPNEHLEQVAGTSYKYCLNREEWTQGDDNRVTIGNQWVVIGNPSQANIETIEKLTEKVKQINAEMMKN